LLSQLNGFVSFVYLKSVIGECPNPKLVCVCVFFGGRGGFTPVMAVTALADRGHNKMLLVV